MLINESTDELLERIEGIVCILAEREFENSDDPELHVVEAVLHKVITNVIEEVRVDSQYD